MSSMTEDSHNLSWEDDDESMMSLLTEITIYSRRRGRCTIYSTAIAPFHAVASSAGRYHVLRQKSLDFTFLQCSMILLSSY